MEKYGLFIVGLFLLINLIIGLWAGRNVKDVKDYAIGNKKWSVGALVMTYLATGLGGELFFREVKEIYDNGIGMIFALFGIPISHFIRAFFLSKNLNKLKPATTTADVIGIMYGRNAEIFTGFLSFIYGIIISALQIKCLGIIAENFFEIGTTQSLIISGLIISLYTSFGGMRAVIATDIFQLAMIFVTLFLIIAYTVTRSGGLFNVIKSIPIEKINFLKSNNLSLYISFFILDAIFSWEMAESARFQRSLMADNSIKLKKSLIYSGIGSIIGILCIGIIAVTSINLVSINSLNEKNLTCFLLKNYIPTSLIPIAVIGLISVVFSSGDSWIHSIGISFVKNFIEPITKKPIKLTNLKLIVFLGGCLSTFFSIKGEFIFFRFEYVLSMVGPILAPAILLGLLKLKTSPRMFLYSTIISLLTFISFKVLITNLSQWALLFSTIVNTISLILINFIENKKIFFTTKKY